MILFQKLHPLAYMPTRGSEGAAGFDLYSLEIRTLQPGERAAIETGMACAIPPNWCGQIWPRSGLAVKQGVDRLAGLIDEDYRGEIKVALINEGSEPVEIRLGDRIGQLVVVPYMADATLVDELPGTVRGDGGFGSTGK